MINKGSAARLFSDLIDSAKDAGLYNKFFPGFGTLLGIIRENDFIVHDDDLDMCILDCSKDQKKKYKNACEKRGLFRYRRRIEKRQDNNDLVWFSVRKESSLDKGVKSCNWFFFKHRGYYYHTKGAPWAVKYNNGTNKYQAAAKGIPNLFNELIDCPIDFYGLKFKIPKLYGTILDMWYPNWKFPAKGGCSKKEALLLIKKWEDKNTWIIKK